MRRFPEPPPAGVIHAGVSADSLPALAAASARPAGTSLVMPLVVFADLLERRVTADVATSVVAALLRHRAVDAEFVTLRSAIEQDINVSCGLRGGAPLA